MVLQDGSNVSNVLSTLQKCSAAEVKQDWVPKDHTIIFQTTILTTFCRGQMGVHCSCQCLQQAGFKMKPQMGLRSCHHQYLFTTKCSPFPSSCIEVTSADFCCNSLHETAGLTRCSMKAAMRHPCGKSSWLNRSKTPALSLGPAVSGILLQVSCLPLPLSSAQDRYHVQAACDRIQSCL